MKHSTVAALLFTAAAVTASAAWAGEKAAPVVLVDTVNHVASGSLGTARNVATTYSMVGCWVNASSTGSPNGYCAARNSAAVTGVCTTTSPELIEQIRTISGDSFIRFYWDESGYCTSILVSNYSSFEPKAP